jgi:hypothetical protein
MANGTNRRLDVSEFDFDDIKLNLKTFLKAQTTFKDYDFEGSGINSLLDVLAYNTHYLGFNLNMVANEMFMDTSTLRSSIVSHAKTLGYEVDSCRAPYADVNIILNDSTLSSATMSAGTVFTTKVNNIDYQFVTVEDMTRTTAGSSIPFNNIKIYEGTYVTSRYTVDYSSVDQRFILPEDSADTSTLSVEVQNSATDTATTTFIKATDISQLTRNSNVYYLQEVEAGKFEVYFGDGVVSKNLTDGNVVFLKYVVTNKKEANGADSFTSSGSIDTVTSVTVTTLNKAVGGSESEALSSIKINAPLDYASQGRCVTSEDYKLYAKKLFPQTQAVMVFGGDVGSYDPSLGVTDVASYGRVYISIKSTTGNVLTSAQKAQLISDFRKYNVASITPVIIDPEIVYIILNVNFSFDSSKTTKEKNTLVSDVNTTLTNYNNNSLKSFNNMFRHSYVSTLIDDTNDSILSNVTNVTLAKYFTPILGTTDNTGYNLYFNNAFYNPHTEHNKSSGGIVGSTGFIVGIETEVSFFDDDGSGNLRRYQGLITRTYIDSTAGTINYTTGHVIINAIKISSISNVDGLPSTKIRMTVIPSSKDIVPVRNQILELDMVNISVSGEIDTIAVGDSGASSSYTTSTSYSSNTSY